jgi:PKD repeat protein
MGNKQLIEVVIVSVLLTLLVISPSMTSEEPQVFWGFIYYSDGSPGPVDIVVTLTNHNNSNSTTTVTIESLTGKSNYYVVDIFAISGTQNGDTVQANVSYGGCTGFSENLTIDIAPPSQHLDVTIYGNLPPIISSQPSGPTSGYRGTSYSYSTSTTDLDGDQVYYWFDWDDGTDSGWLGPYASDASGNASHVWNAPGTYQVKTKAKDEHGAERGHNATTGEWSDPVTVTISNPPDTPDENEAPTADFTYTPTNPIVNTLINFTDASVDDDGNIVNWSWNFGDGTNSTEQNPTHNYTQPGSYLVNLTVTDDDQAQDTIQKTINVISPSVVSEENLTTIMLKYDTTNKAHKGRNLIAWRGDAVSASMLAVSAQLSYGDSISIFNTSTGQWKQYIVNVSDTLNDFNISTWDVIDIRTNAEKNIKIDISKTAETSRQITLQYIPYSTTTTGNYGYNYFVWTSTIPIKASDLVKQMGLSSEPISKYDPQTNTWMGYITGLGVEQSLFDFTISTYDIVCVKVNEEKSFTIT